MVNTCVVGEGKREFYPERGIFFHSDGVDLQNRSIMSVFFNDLVSTRYRRDVYLNWQNILATFGGLLSLMLGFTLISGFDLLIFCTFRPAYDSITYILKQLKEEPNNHDIHSKINFNKTNNWMVDPVKMYSEANNDSTGRRYGDRY